MHVITGLLAGDNVDNLFAAIAMMLMLTVIPNMVFNAWRIRREQKDIKLGKVGLMINRTLKHVVLALIVFIWVVPFVALIDNIFAL